MHMVSVVFRSFSLLSAENLVRVDANLPTSVRNIEATLAGRDQTRCQTALVVSSPIVQQLSIASTTRGYGVWWNAVAAIHPYISVASEHLVAGLLEFVSAEANVGGSLARHHLGRQHFTLVHCPSGVNGSTVGVVSGDHCARRSVTGRGRYPDVVLLLDEHLVGVDAHLLAAKWNV